MSVKAICKICNNAAPSDQFRLHHGHRQMVCPSCFKGKPIKKEPPKPKVEEKPAGWDKEDEYLARLAKKKVEKAQFKKIPGSSHLECTCKKCTYKFKYDPFKKQPRSCPYCNENIPRLKTFGLL